MHQKPTTSFVDTIPKPFILFVTVLFAAQTVYAISQFGVLGLFIEATQNSATLQIFIDLILCASLLILWIRHDSKQLNRNFPFWAMLTLIAGAFGPLLYLLTRKQK